MSKASSSSFAGGGPGQGQGQGGGQKQARDIEAALAQLTNGEVYDILREVKAWVKRDPDGVRDLLAQRPVLAQALLKMQIAMGMLQTPPPADASFGMLSTTSFNSTSPMPSLLGMTAPPAYGQQQQQQQQHSQHGHGSHHQFPPPAGYGPYVPPGLAGPPQQPQQSLFSGIDPQQFLQNVLTMSDAAIAQLSPEDQATVYQIRRAQQQQR